MSVADNLTQRLFAEALFEAVLETAPACVTCGAAAVEAHVERNAYYGEETIQYALETYRCGFGHRYARRFELDRITKEEREAEREKALKRADFVDEETKGFLGGLRLRSARRLAWRMWPPREEPDLMERYLQERAAAEAEAA